MRLISLFLILALVPLLSGCEYATAQASPEPSRVLWNESDVSQSMEDLRQGLTTELTRLDDRITTLEQASIPPNPTFPESASPLALNDLPRCIHVGGIDYDLEEFLEDWCQPDSEWTWAGQDGTDPQGALRRHLTEDLHVGEIDTLAFGELQQVHEAVHHWTLAQAEKTLAAAPPVAVEKTALKTREKSQTQSVSVLNLPAVMPGLATGATTCPNGQCRQPAAVSVQRSAVSQQSSSHFSSRSSRRVSRRGR